MNNEGLLGKLMPMIAGGWISSYSGKCLRERLAFADRSDALTQTLTTLHY